jgi:hypothetical protein|tara:strand:+ start:65 stop:292 length:228 start_codon:yes stop_codon:yes gene_type:complete
VETRTIEKLNEIIAILKGEQVEDGYMDINGVAKYSSMSRSAIRRACKDGLLEYNDSQGKHLFKKSSVEHWLQGGK